MQIQKLKKYLFGFILFGQLFLNIFTPIAFAQEGDAANPTPSKNNEQATKDSSAIKEPTSSSFSVTKYLTAPGQEQKYFESENPIAAVIIQAINFLIMTIGSFSFVMIVGGGFILLISNGNENLVNKGKDMIIYSVIGLVVALSAYIIVAYTRSIFYELPGK